MEVAWCSEHGLPHSALLAWSLEDRAKLIAHLVEDAGRCQLCGTSDWEWERDRHAYTPVERVCTGCYLKEVAGEDAASSPGRNVVLVPTAVAERMTPMPLGEEEPDGLW